MSDFSLELLSRQGAVNGLAVLIEDTVGRGLTRLPLPEIGGHQQNGGDEEENCTEFYLDEDDLMMTLIKPLSGRRGSSDLHANPDKKLYQNYCPV